MIETYFVNNILSLSNAQAKETIPGKKISRQTTNQNLSAILREKDDGTNIIKKNAR